MIDSNVLFKAIKETYKGAEIVMRQSETDIFVSIDGEEKPLSEIEYNVDLYNSIEVEMYNANQVKNRKAAYQAESDPLFFDWQKGEIEKHVWLDKVAEIKERFPYK